jgi:cellulose synthase/poly-beta-1,6-N-acetylglucosamine synthase-like glycosyltransferase
MSVAFWASVLLILYAYVGYPCALAIRARLAPRPVRKKRFAAGEAPGVSIVLAVRNEAHRLPTRLANLLALDYDGPRQIVVVSDGSTDGTRDVVGRFGEPVEFVEVPHGGKASALNAGAARARHPVLVFADARQSFERNALTELVANFADPSVGGVSGELVLDCEDLGALSDSEVAEGVGLYWRFEKWMRRQESAIHSMLGATGAIYALRRELWQPLPSGTILDDVLAPMRAVLQGSRVVFDDRARAYDRVARDADEEQRRKIRTIAGNYQILALEPSLLVPFRNPVWLQYLSHKVVARLLVPFALIACFLSSAALAPAGGLYAAAFAAQLAFYLLALYGATMKGLLTRAARVAYAFVVMNAAGVQALVAVARGRTEWR